MKKLKTILLVVLLAVAVVVGVIYFVDTPVVEEGAEPTVAQKIILVAKEKLNVILAALGVSAVAVMTFCVRAVAVTSSDIASSSSKTSATVDTFADATGKKTAEIYGNLQLTNKKMDVLADLLFTTFLTSEMPASVRATICEAKDTYAVLNKGLVETQQVLAAVAPEPVVPTVVAEEKQVEEVATEPTIPYFSA